MGGGRIPWEEEREGNFFKLWVLRMTLELWNQVLNKAIEHLNVYGMGDGKV